MKKIYSLLKACMTSDMKIFKINSNKKTSAIIPVLIAGYLMFMFWGMANTLFEKLKPTNMQYILLPILTFNISLLTIIQGIYKTGPLMFNCKDDILLLSLPIKKRTILFVRIFKFYVFELLFNSLFMLPIMIAYIRWGETIDYTYYITSIVMLLTLPIIPIIISCIIGSITTNISSNFKYKNIAQIAISFIFLSAMMFISFNIDEIIKYLITNATSINDLIAKIYYPSGIYVKLLTEFSFTYLLQFILTNICIFTLTIYILSKSYFKINSKMNKVIVNKNNNITIKQKTKMSSLIKKELSTFFKTPVFIINSGFSLVLFVLLTFVILFKFDTTIPYITNIIKEFGMKEEIISNNSSILILILILITSYTTSITSSIISLEGKKINILKSLPINEKTILMSKIYSCLVITTPILLIGSIILSIKFKIKIIELILLLILSILIPLTSHFIGLIINLKYPKLDAKNSTEIVKQSASSFISVMIGIVLLVTNITIIINSINNINSALLLIIVTIIYILLDSALYLYLNNKSIKDFKKLTI